MAKKDPTDLTVEEKLKALYQLQTTLSAIDEKRALRGELPLEVQDLEDDIAGLTTRIEKIQTDIEQFDRAIDQKQHEIEEAQASVERYKKQLEMVSNNREYDTLSKEIEFQELEIELCNKKIREGLAKMREREYDLHKAEEQKADREKGTKKPKAWKNSVRSSFTMLLTLSANFKKSSEAGIGLLWLPLLWFKGSLRNSRKSSQNKPGWCWVSIHVPITSCLPQSGR